MQESKQLVKNTTIYALGDIIPRLLGFISFPILTSYLTPADYGVVNYVNTLTTFMLVCSFLCTNTYYLVFFYRCENEIAQKKLLGNLSTFVIGFNILIVLFFLLFGEYLFGFYESNIPFYPYIIIGVLTNFFAIFSILPSALYRLLERPMFLTVLNVSRGLISLVLTIVLVVCFGYSALGVLYANLVVNAVYAVVFLYTTRNYIIWNFNIKQLKTVLIFSLPLVPGSLAYYVTTISDRVLIDKYLNLNDLGIYSTAATLALILNVFSYGAYKAFEPFIFKSWGGENFLNIFEKIRNNFVYILLLGAVSLSIFSKEFFQVMSGVKFHGAYFYVPMIIIGVYCSSIKMLYGTVVTAKGKTKVNSLISIIGAVISIVLNVQLLPRFGLISAALVSSLALTTECLILIWYAKLEIERIRPVLGFILGVLTIFLFVYLIDIDNFFASIFIKIIVLSSTVFLLSKILAVNPFKMIKGLVKK
ncbi:oligosaccharide flippase family protein [Flavobacterium sp. TMP13]|uniref:oligosaccharide flippase family protein n=1 Tax=Flavobacterium sp. TMP13 TaxID=3425950 RepID=UPI003D7726BD